HDFDAKLTEISGSVLAADRTINDQRDLSLQRPSLRRCLDRAAEDGGAGDPQDVPACHCRATAHCSLPLLKTHCMSAGPIPGPVEGAGLASLCSHNLVATPPSGGAQSFLHIRFWLSGLRSAQAVAASV